MSKLYTESSIPRRHSREARGSKNYLKAVMVCFIGDRRIRTSARVTQYRVKTGGGRRGVGEHCAMST